MQMFKELGMIQEVECGQNFGYVLNDEKSFANTEYKVVQNYKNSIFVRCMKISLNGSTELLYLTDDCKPLSMVISNMRSEVFMTIMLNLFASIIEVQDNGFLLCDNLDMDWNKIYVDLNTLKVHLVYIPILASNNKNSGAFENELRGNLLRIIDSGAINRNQFIDNFYFDLSNMAITLRNLYTKITNAGYGNYVEIEQPTETAARQDSVAEDEAAVLTLTCTDPGVRFSVSLYRTETVLGKKPELVDEIISFNSLISRKHCTIIRDNVTYYIVDENSANKTYVNGVAIKPLVRNKISKGDVIRMANSEFQLN